MKTNTAAVAAAAAAEAVKTCAYLRLVGCRHHAGLAQCEERYLKGLRSQVIFAEAFCGEKEKNLKIRASSSNSSSEGERARARACMQRRRQL